jgi:hypothetical protein
VGVVLDEIPDSIRDRVAAAIVARPEEFWVARAEAQLRLTTYRLVFRGDFYDGGKMMLPLPPKPVWEITLSGTPQRGEVDGHDVVSVGYDFMSVLVTDEESPGVAEPALAKVGGVWDEPFVLPIDPELVLQRTGYACMDEVAFPFNSVDSEETDSFYDHTAEVEDSLSSENYHYTLQPTESCVDAVHNHIGAVEASVRFERLEWEPELADRYRFGEVTGEAPDLEVYEPDFAPSRTTYRYVHAAGSGSCEVEEGSVGGTGWRRLLQFATSDENVGETALTIGDVDYFVSGEAGDLDQHHLFELSACHGHYHFVHYGQLGLEGVGGVNAKQGFCLQSTNRVANRETSPLHHDYGGCDHQGVAAGWVDQYLAGLPNQWLDTTDVPAGPHTRTFWSNPEGLLCEGRFVDADGNALGPDDTVVWAPTDLVAADGQTVEAPLCELSAEWDVNNRDSIEVEIEPHGLGLITSACTRGQIGPLRNCGFDPNPTTAPCQPGEATEATFAIPAGAEPQVVRLTEFSHALDSPIPARYEDSYVPLTPGVSDQPAMLANAVVEASAPTTVTFTCPSPRDAGVPEPGGTYSIYTAPVFPDDGLAVVTQS